MDIDECFRKGLIKKTRVDEGHVKSLIEMADIKEDTVLHATIDERNISAYFSLAYDSLRETLEALCILKGYKVLSHVCLGELLNDLLDTFEYEEFDRVRWIRNGINYYGKKVEHQQGKEIINKIFKMKKRIQEKYLTFQ
ncbi:hypothetical protein J4460_01615 [Candidatus Woesearchaeota archaeon]|nr:MAG: hypothetical protein QS99_C0003G0001 [archaeon GW2011_AR4]MBS3129349.1 hypothetical protein [Candidatus Woesearchaeota archaeon]HIH37620.1 hypothetical protein [Candidatus Woesearchaeota archaeon]HIH48761.1 hypothetical protein [Candidatus Woesearchaeota archaeon]HIJ03573.1 hypothetical protein [Candidatus Woesearchaeota archaeon]